MLVSYGAQFGENKRLIAFTNKNHGFQVELNHENPPFLSVKLNKKELEILKLICEDSLKEYK